MEKRKWLWKRKASERSPGESDSSGSFSSHSERYSDEQELRGESPIDKIQSPEVTSKAIAIDDELKESVKCLTEKLSAALVNVSAKEDLVKQHSKVAEEAVAGWEKAENEVVAIKQQLEAALQQNVNLEVRTSHLDGALKECVRQLRQAKDEQDKRIADSILEKCQEWELTKSKLEKRILELQGQAETAKGASSDPDDFLIIEDLEKENSSLKRQLASRMKDLEVLATERDLSTRAAESASKLQLESSKKLVKLEAECRKLQSVARKSSPVNNQKSLTPSSFYAESLTDSNTNGSEPGSDTWASALIAELDHFKNEKPLQRNLAAISVDIDIMDDFLEMERFAALPDTKSNTPFATSSASGECASVDGSLRADLDLMTHRVAELESKLEKMDAEKLELEKALEKMDAEKLELEKALEKIDVEKLELEKALNEKEGLLKAAQSKIGGSEVKLDELQHNVIVLSEAKELLEFQLVGMEVEARTLSASVDSLKIDVEKERTLSGKLASKCQELENELTRRIEESEIQQNKTSNAEVKIKQEDLAVAADKLAECQKTIASLGKQLQSLATLEDFLIDTSNIPGLHSNGIFARKSQSEPSGIPMENGVLLENGNNEDSPQSSSADHVLSTGKSRNGFGRFFTRSKSVVDLGNQED